MTSSKHAQRGSIAAAWVAAIFAGVSGLFAALTFYWTYWKPPTPFEPTVSLGHPVIREVNSVVSIVLGAPVTNNGGQAGCVADMALRVESKTARTQWSYFPVWRISLEKYLRGMAMKEDPFLAVEAPWSPLALPGKGSKEQVILFMPRTASAPKLEPLRVKDLVPGETYVISVLLLHAAPDCVAPSGAKYRVHATTEFILGNLIQDLAKGIAVFPLDTPRDKFREQFIRGN